MIRNKKLNYDSLGLFIAYWFLLNLIINLLAVPLLSFIHEINHIMYRDTIFALLSAVEDVVAYALFFGISTWIFSKLIKKRNIYLYLFLILQFIILNIIVFTNTEWIDGNFTFVASSNSFALSYIEIAKPDITYLLNFVFPVYLSPVNSYFVPKSFPLFYVLYIIVPLLYFGILTWLTEKYIQYKKTRAKN